MLKPETIKELKQNNVSKNAEKTMERLQSIWKPLAAPKREEILELTGLVKSSIQRAYKTGNVSAKIVAAVSQVMEVDPLYLCGISDEQRPYEDDIVVSFLTDLGYDIGKKDIIKKRKLRKPAASADAVAPADAATPPEAPADDTPVKENKTNTAVVPPAKAVDGIPAFSSISASLVALLDSEAKGNLGNLTEDDIILMVKSLSVQAGFSTDKKEKLELIKCLLLI